MARFAGGARQWARDLQAASVVAAIERAPDPAAALARLQARVNDEVIGRLTILSYAAWRDGDHAASRAWADLAVQASLLGGTSAGRAEALRQLVNVTINEGKLEGTVPEARLQAAESAAREAIAIYADAGQTDEHVGAQLSVARLREAGGDTFGAFEAQLSGSLLAAQSADPGVRAGVFGRLCPLYWDLPEERQRAGAELLAPEIGTLLALVADQGTLAELLFTAGHAYHQLGDPARDAAFEAWTRAAAIYQDLGAALDEYLVRSRMFEYAAELGEPELACELGEACIAAAPPDVPASGLADDYQLLAVTYSLLDRVGDAVTAYRQAIRLHLSDPKGKGAASTLYLELGLLEADTGRYQDARRDLESVTSGGTSGFWLVNITLADICYQHLGDLGGAIAHAERALQLSIDGLRNLLCRAFSLHQEATIRARAGDMETAYRRLSQLMPILDQHQPTEPIVIHVSPLCARPVTLPSRAECAQLAARAAEATGRHDEASAYRQLAEELAGHAPGDILPAEITAELDPEHVAALDAFRELRRASTLLPAQPRDALAALARARTLPAATAEPRLTALLDYVEGRCHLGLRDFPAATAAFGRALAALPDGTAAQVRIGCHGGIADIAMADGRHAEAHEHLKTSVDLIESYRSSLPRVEDRMAFLREQIPVYERLVICCIALNLRAEAFSVVQQVKSRSLADLLAQPVHRPIDYDLEGRATLLRAGHEHWVAEYLWNTLEYDFLGSEGYESSPEYRMLTGIIERREQERELAEERHARGLLEELHDQAAHVDFAAAKELLWM